MFLSLNFNFDEKYFQGIYQYLTTLNVTNVPYSILTKVTNVRYSFGTKLTSLELDWAFDMTHAVCYICMMFGQISEWRTFFSA